MVSTVQVINTLTVINSVSFYVSVLWPWLFPCKYNHNHQFEIMNKNIMLPWVCLDSSPWKVQRSNTAPETSRLGMGQMRLQKALRPQQQQQHIIGKQSDEAIIKSVQYSPAAHVLTTIQILSNLHSRFYDQIQTQQKSLFSQ